MLNIFSFGEMLEIVIDVYDSSRIGLAHCTCQIDMWVHHVDNLRQIFVPRCLTLISRFTRNLRGNESLFICQPNLYRYGKMALLLEWHERASAEDYHDKGQITKSELVQLHSQMQLIC